MKKTKHILFLPNWYPNYNDPQLGVFIEKQAKALAKLAMVSVIYITKSAHEEKKLTLKISKNKNFVEIIGYFHNANYWLSFINPLINYYRYFRLFQSAKKFMSLHYPSIDAIHAHVFLKPVKIAWFYRIFKGTPFLVSEHWSGYYDGGFQKKNNFHKFSCKFLARKAKCLIAPTMFLKTAMVKSKVKNKRFFIVPNIIDLNTQIKAGDYFVHSPCEKNNTIKMLTVADLVDETKNISGVIRVIAGIAAKFSNLEYHIIGDGPDRNKLINLAESYGLLNNFVFFHGRKTNEEVLNYMHSVDFVIINSHVETFSVVAAEAIATGKPVVCTRCGGPESFLDNKCGILIDVNNEQQLSDAIFYMVRHYHRFNSEYMQEHIRTQFSSEVVGRYMLDIYNQVLNDKK